MPRRPRRSTSNLAQHLRVSASLLVPNFRDVGESINVLGDRNYMRQGVLYRGGELGLVNELATIGGPRTILNLQTGTDPEFTDAETRHFPAPNSQDVYLAGAGSNRKWIAAVLKSLTSEEPEIPIYVHCAAGKDRTGVIVAAILSCIGIPRNLIAEEYLLSAGPLYPELFSQTIEAFSEASYFRSMDRDAIGEIFLP